MMDWFKDWDTVVGGRAAMEALARQANIKWAVYRARAITPEVEADYDALGLKEPVPVVSALVDSLLLPSQGPYPSPNKHDQGSHNA